MRKLLYIPLLLLVICLSGCEKMDIDDVLMTQFYEESLQLPTYTSSEVQEFGDRFVKTTTRQPELQSHDLYQPTRYNIEAAGYKFTFTFVADDEWEGEVHYNF